MLVREADGRDAHRIAEIHVLSWKRAYAGIVPREELDSLSIDQREEFWNKVLVDPQGRVLASVLGDQMIGWTAFGPSRDKDCDQATVFELYAIYILPEYWGKGYGKKLYRAAEDRISQKLVQEIVVWVLEENGPACGFYKALGFRVELGKQKLVTFKAASLSEVRYRKLLKRE